jgi:hypothetical protein
MTDEMPLPGWVIMLVVFVAIGRLLTKIDEKLADIARNIESLRIESRNKADCVEDDPGSSSESSDESDSRAAEKVADAKRLRARERQILGKNKF